MEVFVRVRLKMIIFENFIKNISYESHPNWENIIFCWARGDDPFRIQ